MRIYMVMTRCGSVDGFAMRTHEAGHIYDVPESLAKTYIKQGYAIPARGKSYPDFPIIMLHGAPVIFQ